MTKETLTGKPGDRLLLEAIDKRFDELEQRVKELEDKLDSHINNTEVHKANQK